MPLDVVLAGSGLEDEFLERAVAIDVGGTRVPIIEVGDLIIAKVLAGRPKDLDDARGLWRIHRRTVDVGRILTTLQLLETALSQSDLISSFDDIARPPTCAEDCRSLETATAVCAETRDGFEAIERRSCLLDKLLFVADPECAKPLTR